MIQIHDINLGSVHCWEKTRTSGFDLVMRPRGREATIR